jgi:putative transposase
VAVWAWVLMPNHVHLILAPARQGSIPSPAVPCIRLRSGSPVPPLGRDGTGSTVDPA